MNRRPRHLLVAVLGLVTWAVAPACGLPDDRTPRVIAAEEAPLDLSEVESGGEAPAGGGDDEVSIYLVRNGLLEPVTRAAEASDVATAIGLLLDGTTEDEDRRGYRSIIPLETELLSVTPDGTVAIVDLGCETEVPEEACGVNFPTGQDQITLFAQLTCTATDVPGVEAVRFLQQGVSLDVATAEGGTVESPETVTCDDYRSLLA